MKPSNKQRIKKGLALPQIILSKSENIAKALHDLAGPSSRQAIASRINMSTNSGKFMQTVASARYYGLIQNSDNGRLWLTDLGTTITTGDESAVGKARKAAVMSTNFGSILYSLRGREVSVQLVNIKLVEDFGIPQKAAERIAGVLIKSSEESGLCKDGKFNVESIEKFETSLSDTNTKGTAKKQTSDPIPIPHAVHLASEARPDLVLHRDDSPDNINQFVEFKLSDGIKIVYSSNHTGKLIANPRAAKALQDLIEALETYSKPTKSSDIERVGLDNGKFS